MSYTVGEEVRYLGEFGFIKEVNEENETYTVELNGTLYENVSEDELS